MIATPNHIFHRLAQCLLLLFLAGCEPSEVGGQTKAELRNSVVLKLTIEHGPVESDFREFAAGIRDGSIATCETARLAGLGLSAGISLPTHEEVSRYARKRTVEYFDKDKYAIFTYSYAFVRRPNLTIEDAEFCFQKPPNAMAVESVAIYDYSSKCSTTDVKYPLPGGTGLGKIEINSMPLELCQQMILENKRKSERIIAEFTASNSLETERIQNETCAYRPSNPLQAIPFFSCLFLEMPIHPATGKSVILRENEDRNVGAKPIIMGGLSVSGKAAARAKATEVLRLSHHASETFLIPKDASKFERKILK
jgi:hypothetical protein